MPKVIRELRKEHGNVKRLLDVLADCLSDMGKGLSPDYVLILDVMHYMTHYPDLFHHPREDLVFERMMLRDAQAQSPLKRLLAEHKELGEKGIKLMQTLRSVINGFELTHDTLELQLEDYMSVVREHMNTEEQEVFPLAAELLTEEDWAQIEAEMTAREDPLFGRTLKREYRNLYRHVVSG